MKSTSTSLRLSKYLRSIATIAIISIGFQSLAPMAMGGPVSSIQLMAESNREADLATIQLALENKIVQQRLEALGFTSGEIQERLALATDAELHQLATESEKISAAGGAGVIVTVLLVILLVLVILRITSTETEMDPNYVYV